MVVGDSFETLARAQLQVLTRRQLLDAGVTPGQLRVRACREWRILLPGIVMLSNGLPTMEQRLMAASLYAGPRSWISGPTAAALHGLMETPVDTPIHLLVPKPQRARIVRWVRIASTTLTSERLVQRGPFLISSAARAAVDAAASVGDEESAKAIFIRAVQSRRVRLEDLSHWVSLRNRRGGARLSRALEAAASGAWSVPEDDLLRLLSTSSVLGQVWANPILKDAHGMPLTTPDAWIDDVALAIMVHSRQYHAAFLDWVATIESDSDLSTAGVVVIAVAPQALREDPQRLLARIERAYLEAKLRGHRPPVSAQPRQLWSSATDLNAG